MLLGLRNSHHFKELKTYVELQKLVARNQSESGFTIIETLMAIIVITVLVVAITPPIFLAVGTRVQNQKAEEAMQLAQRQVDQVRVLIEKGNYTDSNLPPDAGTGQPNEVAAPTSFTCTTSASSNACPFDINGDGKTDFYVQTFRTKGQTAGNPAQTVAFYMGVRVYSALANGQSGLQTTPASLKFTTEQGNQRKYPLAVMYTLVVRSDLKDSLTNYKNFLTPPSPSPSPTST
jgi:type II secretory pathway pseudopilin PulG